MIKPSRLELLQVDLQRKIQKAKEDSLLRLAEDDRRREAKYREHDSFSAPGAVRSYFQERRNQQSGSGSAGHTPSYLSRKKEGYDKSRPLQPINRTNGSKAIIPVKGASDLGNRTYSVKKDELSDFQKWRMEQDALDKQRRLAALGHTQDEVARPQVRYDWEAAEAKEKQDSVAQRKEAEKQRKSLLRQKQEEKRKEQAERGRRRREESERRQRELAENLEHEREAARLENEQAEALQRLEEQLKEKQKDLLDIQRRKAPESPDFSEPTESVRRPIVKASRPAAVESRNTENSQPFSLPSKPKKVNRKTAAVKEVQRSEPVAASPPDTYRSHALNTTYDISRQNSIPLNVDQNPPFVTDGEGLDIVLAECANCGRKFAEERLAKHRKACVKASKPRKKFDMTNQRIAGSGAEKFQYKRKSSQPKKVNKKDWRAQHEEFIQNIRYAKMAAAVESRGGNIAELAPPPKTENPDYVQCPHCERKFNETAAERHIPKCKDIKAKPKMLRKGGRR